MKKMMMTALFAAMIALEVEGSSMQYICKYKTPEGFDDLVMCGDGEALTGLWFEGSRDDWHDPARRICRGMWYNVRYRRI